MLRPLVHGRVVIFMISESKVNNSFPVTQFEISGYTTPCRFDRNNNGGGILLNIREDIPSKTLHIFKLPMEGFLVDLSLYKTNWLLRFIYDPQKSIYPTFWRNFEKHWMFSH